jgi:hypothetical protein
LVGTFSATHYFHAHLSAPPLLLKGHSYENDVESITLNDRLDQSQGTPTRQHLLNFLNRPLHCYEFLNDLKG